MKKGFLILGCESSGTRMLTQAFISAGCFGDSGHYQKFDRPEFVETQSDFIVVRRSIPHGGHIPAVNEWLERFTEMGYEPFVIKLYRDRNCNIASMQNRGHAQSKNLAVMKFNQAEKFLEGIEGIRIEYRKFVTDQEYRKNIFSRLGLPEPKMRFFNADTKYQ